MSLYEEGRKIARRYITHRAELEFWRTVALDLLTYADEVQDRMLDNAATDALRAGKDAAKAKA